MTEVSGVLLVQHPHLAGSGSCGSRRLCSDRPEEARRPLHRGVSPSVEQDVGVACHHLALLHHRHSAVIKQTPACLREDGGGREERLETGLYNRATEKRQDGTLARPTNSCIKWE